MNWDQIEGNWMQFRGKVRENWGRFTDDDLDVIAGRRDQLVGRVQHAYGCMKEEAERQVGEFEKKISNFSNKGKQKDSYAASSR